MINHKIIINLTYITPEGDDQVSKRFGSRKSIRSNTVTACIGCGNQHRKLCSKNWERRSHLTVKERICYFSYFTGNISDEDFLSRHHESSRTTGKLPPAKLRRVPGPIRPGCNCYFH